MKNRIESFKELDVYKNSINAAMSVYEITKNFPDIEKYSMTDQIRRSSRSVCANLAEAWRKRRYRSAFIAKLSDVESEAAETQVWIELANKCGYITDEIQAELDLLYNHIIAQVITMIQHVEKWIIPKST